MFLFDQMLSEIIILVTTGPNSLEGITNSLNFLSNEIVSISPKT
jgi:hypothetical protein